MAPTFTSGQRIRTDAPSKRAPAGTNASPPDPGVHPPPLWEALHLGLDLRAAEIGHDVAEHARAADQLRALPGRLAEAQHRLGLDVTLVGDDVGDHVDRAGASLEALLRVAVRRHAAEDVVGAGRRRIIVGSLLRVGDG